MFTASHLPCNTDHFGCTIWGKGYANMDLLWREAKLSSVLLLAAVGTACAPSPALGPSVQPLPCFPEPCPETGHRRLSERLPGAHQSCCCCSPHNRGPSCIPPGQVMEGLALLEAAQLPGSQSSSTKAAVAVKRFLSCHMDWYLERLVSRRVQMTQHLCCDSDTASWQWFKFSDVPFLLLACVVFT